MNPYSRVKPQSLARRLANEWDAITLRNLLAAERRDLKRVQRMVAAYELALPIRRAIEREYVKDRNVVTRTAAVNPARRRK